MNRFDDEPYEKRFRRIGDTSSDGKTPYLEIVKQRDGDVIVGIGDRDERGRFICPQVEFCHPFAGGGRSVDTLTALNHLIDAVQEDNRGSVAQKQLYDRIIPETVVRTEDMSFWGQLQLTSVADGTIKVFVIGQDEVRPASAGLLFSSVPLTPSGRCSPRTVAALRAVIVAMKADNQSYPIEICDPPK